MSNELLNLSDEEILNMDLDELTSSAEADEGDTPSDADSGDVVDEELTPAETESEDGSPEDSNDAVLNVPDDSIDSVLDSEEDVAEPAADTDAFDNDSSAEEVEVPEEEPTTDDDGSGIDYKAEYEKLLKPFKANGKDIKVDSVEEAIQLMQMGANYNKKMGALKPNLKLLKMLENNGLLDESKLNYLIDLDKRNPEAIKHLIKESGIDPLDADFEQQTSYKPKSYTVNDKEVELDSVLEEIQDTPTYSKTIDIVSNKWDSASRKLIVEHPQIIKIINEHMQTGVYAQIESVMEKERMLGRLNGMSDLEAYRVIGDRIFASGGTPQQSTSQEPQPVKSTPKPKPADPKVVNRKRAAAPTKAAPKSVVKEDFNPLSLSDDEFEKLVSSKFL